MDTVISEQTMYGYDRILLEYEIKSRGLSIDDFCDAIGISRSTWQNLNQSPERWTRGYIAKAASVLRLTNDQIIRIFFASCVA